MSPPEEPPSHARPRGSALTPASGQELASERTAAEQPIVGDSARAPREERAREDHGRRPRTEPTLAVTRGVMRRDGARWTLDLGSFSTPREAFAGAQMLPPEETGNQGFTVSHSDRLGIMRAAGVRPGDVLVAVNDMPTLDADQALDAYLRLRHNTSAAFRFRRGAGSYVVLVDIAGRRERATSSLPPSAARRGGL